MWSGYDYWGLPTGTSSIINLRLTDPDDIIRRLLAFGARFRTPASLYLKNNTLLGIFYTNSDSGVRSHPKSGELLHIRSAVSDSSFTRVNTYVKYIHVNGYV